LCSAPSRIFLALHLAFVPLALVLLAWFASYSGLDRTVTDFFYDAEFARFPAHDSYWLELLGHRVAKMSIWVIALGTLTATFATERIRHNPHEQRAIVIAVLAMALGPMMVSALKYSTSHHCPWDLRAYGGFADISRDWFVAAADAGRCFPSGHASAGFALISLYFLGYVMDRPTLARAGLIAAIVIGTAFSTVRVIQGAHFLSHNLWAAAIDWFAAALVFSPLLASKHA
jgi:membrane-associated PAP2 superfamily phosphatase